MTPPELVAFLPLIGMTFLAVIVLTVVLLIAFGIKRGYLEGSCSLRIVPASKRVTAPEDAVGAAVDSAASAAPADQARTLRTAG